LKKSNSVVCLADDIRFPDDMSRKRFSVRSLVAVIQLIGISDNRRSAVYYMSTQHCFQQMGLLKRHVSAHV
jgi:hypothetical protein